MPLELSVKSDVDRLSAHLDDLERRQIPFATAKALTLTAKGAAGAIVREMQRVFDRPTPYTLNALYVRPATKSRLEALVKIKDEARGTGIPAIKFLQAEIYGGGRNQKRSERALQRAGILPPGWFTVPGAGAQLDRFGNVRSADIARVLSAIGAAETVAGYSANQTPASRKRNKRALSSSLVRVVRPNDPGRGELAPGIYLRKGRRLMPFLIFVRSAPQYRTRLQFQRVITDYTARHFPFEFDAALRGALATARR